MTDPTVPGGAGLPDPQSSPLGAPPAASDATPEPGADPGFGAAPTESMAEPAAESATAGAGFAMPDGQGFGTPIGSDFGSPPPAQAPGTPSATPPPGWTAGPALKPRSGRRVSIRLIALVAVVAVVVIALYLFRDSLTSAPADLAVGNCFDVPITASAEDSVDTVQHHPCNESHTGEVFFVGDYSPATDTYPAVSDFDTFVGTACKPAFQDYVGTDLDSDPDLSIGYFYPLADGWANGDHGVTCYISRTDNGAMTSSVRNSGTPASTTP